MFSKCTTLEELQSEWRKIAMQLHPDKGGSTDAFQHARINYERAKHRIEAQQANLARTKQQREFIGRLGNALIKVSRGEDWLSATLGIFSK